VGSRVPICSSYKFDFRQLACLITGLLLLPLSACTPPDPPWEPAPEPHDAQQSWKKAGKGLPKQDWRYLETQFVEWGVIPPPPPTPWLGGDTTFKVKPRQTPLQREKDDDPAQQAQTDLHRRFHYIYTRKPRQQGPYRLFQLGSFSQADGRWNPRLQLQRPMRVRCEGKQPRGLEVALGPGAAAGYGPLAIDNGLDGSQMGAANLQVVMGKVLPWLCRHTFK
jgi:hypothetical protein